MEEGKNSAIRRHLRKKGGKNVIDEKRLRLEEMKKERAEREQSKLRKDREAVGCCIGKICSERTA